MRKLAAATFALSLVTAAGLVALSVAMWPRPVPPAPPVSGAPSVAAGVIAPIHARAAEPVPIVKTDPQQAKVRVEPTRIVIADLGIDMPVTALGLTETRGMALPATARKAAWYRYGGLPGEPDDAALIAAHVGDKEGPGPFSALGTARPGTAVTVELSDGSLLDYVVVDVAQLSKQRIDVPQTLASARGMLVLMTCGGRWNPETQHYEDNVLAWAMPSEISWSAS